MTEYVEQRIVLEATRFSSLSADCHTVMFKRQQLLTILATFRNGRPHAPRLLRRAAILDDLDVQEARILTDGEVFL